jgi:DNA-directed RNA polymerase specialized sigma24 family protein
LRAVVQETLIRIWHTSKHFQSDGKPNGLLRLSVRIARNLAISEVRKRKPEQGRVQLEEDTDVAMEWNAPDPLLRNAIRECYGLLPEAPRSALQARLNSGGEDSDETLAARLSMKVNTFLQNFTRARKQLAECLGKKGIATELAS